MKDYKAIFTKLEASLRENYNAHLKDGEKEFDEAMLVFKNLKYEPKSDDWYFDVLKFIPFYAGFKAQIVNDKVDIINKLLPDFKTVAKYNPEKIKEIAKSEGMINVPYKISAVVANANLFLNLIEKYGSIHNYFEQFKPADSEDNMQKFYLALQYAKNKKEGFKFLGPVTAYHFMTEIGLNVSKPDRVLERIFYRLGLITDRKDHQQIIIDSRKFAEATGYPIRYIDIVFVIYGQDTKVVICDEKNPKCNLCQLQKECQCFNNKDKC